MMIDSVRNYLVIVPAVIALGLLSCGENAVPSDADAGVAVEGTGGSVTESPTRTETQELQDRHVLLEFVGTVNFAEGTMEIDVLPFDQWESLDEDELAALAAFDGENRTVLQGVNGDDFCEVRVTRGFVDTVQLDTVSPITLDDDCPRSGPWSYLGFQRAFCSRIQVTSNYDAPVTDLYAEITRHSSPSHYMYDYLDKIDFGLGNGGEPPTVGNNRPTDVNGGLVVYGNLEGRASAPANQLTEWWVFKRGTDEDVQFFGRIVATFMEICDGIDQDCDHRVDEQAGCIDEGGGCVDHSDCAGGACDCGGTACAPGVDPWCRTVFCGDFLVDGGEECDEGGVNTPVCDIDCSWSACRDGTHNAPAGEECDDGDANNNNACSNTCTIAACSDGITRTDIPFGSPGHEECDDGNGNDIDACRNNCNVAICGDGVTRADLIFPDPEREECDEGAGGNGINSACPNCLTAHCGDGYVRTDIVDPSDPLYEECDGDGSGTGGETAACTQVCTVSACGDGILNVSSGETCDEAGNTLTCDIDCSTPACNDSVYNPAFEPCDDSNGVNQDNCLDICILNSCGDGWVDGQAPRIEACDGDGVGSGGETAVCDVDCSPTECNDGLFNPTGEICDTGGNSASCDVDCTLPACQDDVFNAAAGEPCDDSNGVNEDDCTNACTIAVCGDGWVDLEAPDTEECDGNDDGTGGGIFTPGCDPDCTTVVCNDGFFNDLAEICDTGGNSVTCDVDCTFPACQDGVFNAAAGEPCDDSNGINQDDCTNVCTAAVCGDGWQDLQGPDTEACDGNNDGTGGGTNVATCDDDCTPPACNDSVYNPAAEICDTGGDSPTCDVDCTVPGCGDGHINATFTPVGGRGTEQCDNAANNNDLRSCVSDCRDASCGDDRRWFKNDDGTDMITSDPNYEECDLNNSDSAANRCRTDCRPNRCGDDVLDTGEACDDGEPAYMPHGADCAADGQCNSDIQPGACRTNCEFFTCGDDVIDPGEPCDEGQPGFMPTGNCDDDGQCNSDVDPNICRVGCVLPFCSDGITDNLFGELCDDGNNFDNDDCRPDCSALNVCGDGVTDLVAPGVEACDDGDGGGDGCTGACTVEPGWSCPIHGGDCVSVCGDGLLRGDEACDDGNLVPNDGCSATCTIEPGWVCTGEASVCGAERCGDAIRAGAEACDTGGNTAGCDSDCTFPSCGDNHHNPSFDPPGPVVAEQCDTAGNSPTCDSDCTIPLCNDGIQNLAAEPCDTFGVNTATCDFDCTIPNCGDGNRNSFVGEACDDGNSDNSDDCLNACILNSCGDGWADLQGPATEACDGNDDGSGGGTNTATCDTDCTLPLCDDGIQNLAAEPCDTFGVFTAGCNDDCTLPACGDGKINAFYTPTGAPGPEQCDDGNTNNTDDCVSGCQNARCGDGYRWSLGAGTEPCDDGNTSNTDDCLNICENNVCGDGWRDMQAPTTEPCDGNNDGSGGGTHTSICNNNCSLPSCGDTIVNSAYTPPGAPGGEECDDGNANNRDACVALCQTAACGDGYTQSGVEVCDDGNKLNTDDCISAGNTPGLANYCQAAACGDNYNWSGQDTCAGDPDDGNTVNTDSCVLGGSLARTSADGVAFTATYCVQASCSDGNVWAGVEDCDDGNTVNTDDCVACGPPSCGDGYIWSGEETCDDGNTSNTDACVMRSGAGPVAGSTRCIAAGCGDGYVYSGIEECDGNDPDGGGPQTCPMGGPGGTGPQCYIDFDGDQYIRDSVPGGRDCDDGDAGAFPASVNDDISASGGAWNTANMFDSTDRNCDGFSGNISQVVLVANSCAVAPTGAVCETDFPSAFATASSSRPIVVRGALSTTTPILLENGTDIYGGWPTTWSAWTGAKSGVTYNTNQGAQFHSTMVGGGLSSVTVLQHLDVRTVNSGTASSPPATGPLETHGISIGDSPAFRLFDSRVEAGPAYYGRDTDHGDVSFPTASGSNHIDCWHYSCTPYAGPEGGGQGNGWTAWCPPGHVSFFYRGNAGLDGGGGGGSSVGLYAARSVGAQVERSELISGRGGNGGIFGGRSGQAGQSFSFWTYNSTLTGLATTSPDRTAVDCTSPGGGVVTNGGNTLRWSESRATSGGAAMSQGRPGSFGACHVQTEDYEWFRDCNPQRISMLTGRTVSSGSAFAYPTRADCECDSTAGCNAEQTCVAGACVGIP